MTISPNEARGYLGSLLMAVDFAFDRAEKILEQAVSNDPENTFYLLLICQLYQKKTEYADPGQKPSHADEIALSNYAQIGLRILDKKPKNYWASNDYRYQGEFLLFLARYSEAKAAFDEAVARNPNAVEARLGQGIASQKIKKWDDALLAFQQANRLDTSDLSTRCTLAETLIELEKYGLAQEQLTYVLRVTESTHTDALMLMGKLYARLGDKARTNDDNYEANGRYREAITFLGKVLQADQYGRFSRKITPYERNTVHYLNGYCQVRQLQAREKKEGLWKRFRFATKGQDDIKKALNQFREIAKCDYAHNLFEARQAIDQLEKYKQETTPMKELGAQKGLLIIFLAGFVLVTTQLFFLGREVSFIKNIVQPTAEYHIQPDLILKQLPLDSLGKLHLATFSRLSFANPDELKAAWDKTMGTTINFDHAWIHNTQPANPIFSEGYYMSITFIALFFILAGLVLPELTRLKVGNIELEKAKLETISTTTSLNISGSSTLSRP